MAGKLATQLRHKREERGLSPQEACRQTHIPEPYLHLLEGQGDPHLLPDSLYLIPFLRSYSTFLDLDPAETVARFLAETPETTAVEGSPRQASRADLIRRFSFARPIVIGLVVLVLIGLGVYFFKDNLPWLESLGSSPGSR